MTIAAERPTYVLAPGTAQQTLREMAAVIRTVFGVGLQASRQATVAGPVAVHHELTATETPAAAPSIPVEPQAAIPVNDRSAGIAVPGIPVPGIAVPGIPVEGIALDEADAAVEPEPEVEQVESPAIGLEIPMPDFSAISPDRRSAVLQELAFLDD